MMRKTIGLGLGCAALLWGCMVLAQDEVPADADPAAAEAESAAVAEPAAEEAAATEAPADSSADTAAAEGSPDQSEAAPAEAEQAPAEERKPWPLYVGVDMDRLKLSLSDPALASRLGGQTVDSTMLRLRAGVRFFDLIGVELHLGSGSEDDEPGKFGVGSYAGLFVAPTGVLFDTIELAALVGYTQMKAEHGAASETLRGQAYGLNVELPLRSLGESLPNLRVGLGHIVFNAKGRYRTQGLHFGLRYDFNW